MSYDREQAEASTDELVAFLRERLYADDEPRAERLMGVDDTEARRQLAEVESKRRILDLCERNKGEYYEDWIYYRLPPMLALPYRDHPDYRDEWAPVEES